MSASVTPSDPPPLGLWLACVMGLAAMWIMLLLLDYHHRSRARHPMALDRIMPAMMVIHPQLDERLPPVECPAPPPSPRLKRISEPQEADEKFSRHLRALLEIELNNLLPSRVLNSSLYTFPSYIFSPERMVGWDSASRATQVQKRMLSDPRLVGVPEEDWEKPEAWDPRDRHPIEGYEIDEDEYYEGTGGYFETWKTWQKVKRGYWMEKLLGPTKKDKGKQLGGKGRSFIVNIEESSPSVIEEAGPQSAVDGGPQSVVEGGLQSVVEERSPQSVTEEAHQPVFGEGRGPQSIVEEGHQRVVEGVGSPQSFCEDGSGHQYVVVEERRPQSVFEGGGHQSVLEGGGSPQPIFEDGNHESVIESPQSNVEAGGRPQSVFENGGHPRVRRRDGSGSSSVYLSIASNSSAHSMRQRSSRATS